MGEASDYDQHMGQIWEEQVERHYVPGAGRGCLEDLSQTALFAGVSPFSSLSPFLLKLQADFRYSLVTQFPAPLLYLRRCVVKLAECLLLHVFLFNSMPKATI